jgi:hypothetical protein
MRATFASVSLVLVSGLMVASVCRGDAASDIEADYQFSIKDHASPGVADCNPGHAACCAAGPEGLFSRNLITQKAVGLAKLNQCSMAAAELAVTQCHNPPQAVNIATHPSETCRVLQSH